MNSTPDLKGPPDAGEGLPRGTMVGGILLLLGAACLWSLNGALIKLISMSGAGPGPVTIAFYRSLFAGLVLIPVARGRYASLLAKDGKSGTNKSAGSATPTGRPASTGIGEVSAAEGAMAGVSSIRPEKSGMLRLKPAACWCVVAFTLMTVCFVAANTMTKAANAIILQYTSTFWVFGLSPWLLKERPGAADLRVLLLAFAGIVVIFLGDAATDLWGLVVALASGLFFGLLTLSIRQLRDSDSAALTVLNNLGSALLILPFVLIQGSLAVSQRSFVLLVIMGVVQFGLPYYLYSLGLQRVRAYHAAFITMAEPMLVPVWTYLAVGERVPVTTVIGGMVILAALFIFGLSLRKRAAAA